jgi:hypothetical protein
MLDVSDMSEGQALKSRPPFKKKKLGRYHFDNFIEARKPGP